MRVKGSDFFAALTIPIEKNHCTVIIGGWGGGLCGISSIDYMDAAENPWSEGLNLENERWYTLRVRVTLGVLQIFLDENLYTARIEFENSSRFSLRSGSDRTNLLGRANKTKSGGTVAFIRNRRRDAFTLVPASGEPQDLSFVECARELNAKPSEKTVPLPTGHHEQVRLAVEHFEAAIQSELTANRKVTSKHTPSEQSPLALLKTLAGFHLLNAEEQHLCRVASEAVGKVKFQKLAGKLSSLAKKHKKELMPQADFIDRVLAVLKSYPLLEPSNPDVPDAPPAELTPDIIISESFV